MIPMLILAAPLVLSLLSYHVIAQRTITRATCDATGYSYSWMFNSLNQNPCDVGAALGGVCNGGDFTLPALPPGNAYGYLGPEPGNASPCTCNSVFYSLVAACSICQSHNFIRWSLYTTNCTTVYAQVFPKPIPNGVAVPHYAYLDVETDDIFNITAAQAAGGPESTRAPIPTGSVSSSASAMPSAKKNVSAIAGGVVGGVVGLAVIAGLVFWLLRRRAKTASSPLYDMASRNPASPTEKAYDTNDPSSDISGYTLPYAPPELQQQGPNQPKDANHILPDRTGTTGASHGSAPQYRGAPEV